MALKHFVWIAILCTWASAREAFASAEREIVILIAGDSFASYDQQVVRSWPELLREGLPERGLSYRVEVLELDAQATLEDSAQSFQRRLKILKPEIVVFAFEGAAQESATSLFSTLRTLGRYAALEERCLLIATPPSGGSSALAPALRDVANELDAYVLDLAALPRSAEAGAAGWRREDGGLSAEGHLAFVRLLRRRLVELRASEVLNSRAVPSPELNGTADTICVADGVLQAARDARGGYVTEGGILRGRGWIESTQALGAGDFRIECEVALDALDGSEAGLELGGLYCGFDMQGGHFFLDGPLAGGERVVLEPHRAHWGPGSFVTMEFLRANGEFRWRIGKYSLTAMPIAEALTPVRLDAGRGRIQVRHLRMRGTLTTTLDLPAARCSLPYLDLSAAQEMQVVVDREADQYLGHVTMAQLADRQTLLATYPKGHGRGAIVMKRSIDGGATWSERMDLPPSFATSLEVPTIYNLGGAAGAEHLILFSGLYPIRASHSADGGATWSELEAIGNYGGIVAMSSLERLHDGTLAAWFHDDGRFLRERRGAARFRLFQVQSRDEGHTWSQPRNLLEASRAHYCEPGSLRSPDGKTIALLLRENSRTRFSAVIFSADEGQTWSAPRALPASLMGDRHTLRYLADGRVIASFRDMAFDSETAGDWVGWIGHFEDLLHAGEGELRLRFLDNHDRFDCAYPGLEVLADGTIVTVTYGHWTKGEKPYIVAVRVHPRELEKRRGEK